MEETRQTKINVRWPITLIVDQGTVEVESRNITNTGIFIQSIAELPQSESYQMIIRGPKEKSVLVRGRLAWANVDEKRRNRSLPGSTFFFLKVIKEDREVLRNLISEHSGT